MPAINRILSRRSSRSYTGGRRFRLMLSAAASIALAVATVGAEEPNLSLQISNETGNTIEHIFLRQTGNRVFGGDILSVTGDLDTDDTVSTGIQSSFSESLYELKAIDSEDTVYRVDGIRVGSGTESNMTSINLDSATDSPAPEITSTSVVASLDTDVFYVYLERIDTQDLGANLAGGNMIPEGSAEEIRYMASEVDELGSFILVDNIGATVRVNGPGEQ